MNGRYSPRDVHRFVDKINFKGSNGCWEWRASTNRKGYGWFWDRTEDTMIGSHRASYEIHNDTPPGESHVLHKCDNPQCANPKHLYLGDNSQNMKDAYERGLKRSSGQNNGNAKLTPKDVCEIRTQAARKTRAELGREYGVSPTMIRYIDNREHWSELDCEDFGL